MRRAGRHSTAARALPTLSTGTHTLELASFVVDGSVTRESPRSAALRCDRRQRRSGFSASSLLVVTAEQVRLNLAPVAEGLQLSFGSRLRAGWIDLRRRARRDRALVQRWCALETPALDLSLEITRPEGGLLAIALDPKFDENGFMFALYAVDAPRNGLEFTLARFRFVNGVFGERAVLLDRTKASVDWRKRRAACGAGRKAVRRVRQRVRRTHRWKLCHV